MLEVKLKRQQKQPGWVFMSLSFTILSKSSINSHMLPQIDLRKEKESSLVGKFPFWEPFSTEYWLWTRTVGYGLAQLSVRTDQKEGSLKESTTSTAAGTSTEINSCLFKVIMRAKCVLIMLEWNYCQLCPMQPQNRSFQVINWKKTVAKWTKLKKLRSKRAKLLLFIVKHANLWRSFVPSPSWWLRLLKVISA